MAGLDVVALTDHDLPPALAAGVHQVAGRSIRVLAGAEVSGVHEGSELHMLVYFPAEMPEDFRVFLEGRAQARAARYDAAREGLGLEGVPCADPAAHAGQRSLTRFHLAQALVDAGHCGSIQEAFTRWLSHTHGLVPMVDVSVEQVIHRAKDSGGLVSWAHPQIAHARSWARDFAAMGLDALEVPRPGVGRGVAKELRRIAHKCGLLVTGGSDWHGWGRGGLGAFSFTMREAKPVARRLGLLA
jgi:predicted metal-dependent phosphoesterase TrpH